MSGRERLNARLCQQLAKRYVMCDCHAALHTLEEIGFTLLTFSLDPGQATFGTSLATKGEVIEAFEALLVRWESGNKPVEITLEELGNGHLIRPHSLEICGDIVKRTIPSTDGYALLVGQSPYTRYIAHGARNDVATMLREDLLPAWREEVGKE